MWLRIFKHLLPDARAWRLTTSKTLRSFFEGLGGAASDARSFVDDVHNDLWPDTTRELDLWLDQFGLYRAGGQTETELRSRLDAAWKSNGGQSPAYIQRVLQAAGFDVYVHEWWEPIPDRPAGGSIDGDVTPVARNPFDYLDDGTGAVPWAFVDGGEDAQDGDPVAQDGGTNVPPGYPLVNKIIEAQTRSIGDGAADMADGDPEAQDGGVEIAYPLKTYQIPVDPTKYPYFLYIGGEAFPDTASVPAGRRDEFEELCLKICPTEQWLGIIVEYS